MAEKTIKNPSLLPGDLDIELSGNAITAISGHPLIGTGGGTQSDYVYYPDFDETTGNIEFKLGTIDNPPSPIGGWHISGADGARGPQGDPGDDGISPTISTEPIAGGNRVTFTYDTPSKTEYIDVMSGAPGAPGAEGFSPTVTTSEISPTIQHPQGGTSVTITDSAGAHQFDVWNGLNGEGATVNLLEGTGIQITENGTDYTIGVSADYALKSELPDVTDMATKTWVGQQGYATETYAEAASANALSEAVAQIPDVTSFITKNVDDLTYYYKKTETSSSSELSTEFAKKVNKPDTSLTDKYLVRTDTNGAVSGWCNYNDKIYSKSESDGRYMQKNTDSTLSGDGTTNNLLGIKTDAALNLTNASAKSAVSAEWAQKAKYGATEYNIGHDLYQLYDWQNSITDWLEEGPGGRDPGDTLYADYAGSAYIDSNTVSSMAGIVNELHGKLDSTAAASTYQTKTDMTNYYQKTETSGATELSTEFNSRVKYFSPVTNQYTPGGNDYQHYIDNTQTFNYYKVQVHPYSASPTFSDDGIIHIVLEQ